MIEFGILGPLVVQGDVGEVRIAGARRRALLVRLLTSVNRPVSAERLADDLWDGMPPAGARSTLASHISLLRGLLGSDRIWSRDGGYALKAADLEVDARLFESETDRGRQALRNGQFHAASMLLGHALQRWRGDPLADVVGASWAIPEISRLEEMRLGTLDAWISLGEHDEVIPTLESLAEENPLQERLWAQLMLALYRSGRQADALRTYRKLQVRLGEELGIVPSEELVRLEEAIIRQEGHLALSPSTADSSRVRSADTSAPSTLTQAESSSASFLAASVDEELPLTSDLRWVPSTNDPEFLGRDREVEKVHDEWRETVFRPRLVIIEGGAGVGKTRLVAEAARRIDASGGMVLFGRCDEEAVRPCQPLAEVLDYLAALLPDDVFYSLIGPYADGLSYLSRPVARRLGIEQPQLSLHAEADRYRLLEGLSSAMADIGAHRALLLVIDDLQWADPLALIAIRHLLNRLEPTPVTIVATARNEDPAYRHSAAKLVSRLDSAVPSSRLLLEGLQPEEVVSLVRRREPTIEPAGLLAEVWRVTRGNPFFVLQIVHQLGEDLARTASTGSNVPPPLRVPRRVQDLIDLRVSKLSGDAIAIMTVGSVIGEQFLLDNAARIAGLDFDSALMAADELIAARLVTTRQGADYRFDHDLVRRAVYESISPGRRLLLHRDAGRCLATSVTRRPPAAEIAHHFGQAAVLGPDDAKAAASWARAAGDSDFSQLAFESAATRYESALSYLERLPTSDSSLAAELSIRLGESLNGAGETERGKIVFRQAYDFARDINNSELKASAALLYGGSLPLATNVDDEHPSRMLRETLEGMADDDRSTRARCLSRLALWQYRSGPRSDRQALCDEALRLAREVGDQRVLAAVLNDRSWALFGPDDCHDQLAAGDEMVSIGQALEDPVVVLHGQQCRLHALLELGPADEARETGDTVVGLANSLRHPAHLWSSTVHRALRAAIEGRFLEAEALAEDGLRLHRPSDQAQAVVAYGTQRFQRHWLEGRLHEDRAVLVAAVERSPERLSMVAATLWSEVEAGDRERARLLFDRVASVGWDSIPKDLEWWPIMVSAALATRLLEDRLRAQALYELILPYRDHNCIAAGVAFFGNAEHVLGILADVSGEAEVARAHLRSGLLRYEEWQAAPFATLARHDLGMLMLRGDEESRREGGRLVNQSLLDATRMGMSSLPSQSELIEGVTGAAG